MQASSLIKCVDSDNPLDFMYRCTMEQFQLAGCRCGSDRVRWRCSYGSVPRLFSEKSVVIEANCGMD